MTIAFDAFGQYSGTFSADDSFSLAGAAGLDGVLCVVIQASNTAETITATHNGVNLPAISGSPFTSSTFAEAGGITIHAFFAGSGLSGGTQTVAITKSGSNPCLAGAWSVTTASNAPEVQASDNDIDSAAVVDPSGTIALSGVTCLVLQAFCSGQGAITSITPPTGWTSDGEDDAGSVTVGWYRYDTIGSSDVTYGWTQTSDDAFGIAIALTEPAGGGGLSIPVAMHHYRMLKS